MPPIDTDYIKFKNVFASTKAQEKKLWIFREFISRRQFLKRNMFIKNKRRVVTTNYWKWKNRLEFRKSALWRQRCRYARADCGIPMQIFFAWCAKSNAIIISINLRRREQYFHSLTSATHLVWKMRGFFFRSTIRMISPSVCIRHSHDRRWIMIYERET